MSSTVQFQDDPLSQKSDAQTSKNHSISPLSTVEIHKLRNLLTHETRTNAISRSNGDQFQTQSHPFGNGTSKFSQALDTCMQVPVKASAGEPLQFVPTYLNAAAATVVQSDDAKTQPEAIKNSTERKHIQQSDWRQVVIRYQQQGSILKGNDGSSRKSSLLPTTKESTARNDSKRNELTALSTREINSPIFCRPSDAQNEPRTRLHPLFQLCKLHVWYCTQSPPRQATPPSTIPSVIEYYQEPGVVLDSESQESVPCPTELTSAEASREATKPCSPAYFVHEILLPLALSMLLCKILFHSTEMDPYDDAKAQILSQTRHLTVPADRRTSQAVVNERYLSHGPGISRDTKMTRDRDQPWELEKEFRIQHHDTTTRRASIVDATHREFASSTPSSGDTGHVASHIPEEKVEISMSVVAAALSGSLPFTWNATDPLLVDPGNIRPLEQILDNDCFACHDQDDIPHHSRSSLFKLFMLKHGEDPWSYVWSGL